MRGRSLRRSRVLRAGSHRVTMLLGRSLPGAFPFVFLTGFPKSGTTWIGHMLADYLRISFPRGSLMPVGVPAVIHGHYPVDPSFRECVYVMRDGRDVLVSLYFFLVRQVPSGENPRLTGRMARLFPGLRNKERTRENLPAFIEGQARHPYSTRLNWAQHVEQFLSADRPGLAGVRYEDALVDPQGALSRLLADLRGGEPEPDRVRWAVEKFSFEKQSGGRRPGEESRQNFYRKGQAGDWRNHFTREAAMAFDRHFGDTLLRAGYESDRSWLDSAPPLAQYEDDPSQPAVGAASNSS